MGDVKRLLLVDDDPGILKSLQRTFHGRDYTLFLAESALEALKIIQNEDIELILSDLLMPEMNGYEFLEQVKLSHPDIIRVMLSGLADKQTILKGIISGTIHTYVTKPWNIGELRNEVARMIRLKSSLDRDESKILLLDKLNAIPSFSPRFSDFLSSFKDTPDLDDLVDFIEHDIVLTAQLLRIANSSFFGGHFASIRDVSLFLGSRSVTDIIIGIEIYEKMSLKSSQKEELERLWNDSLRSNRIVNSLYHYLYHENLPEELKAAGLLHHAGLMFFSAFIPESYSRVKEKMAEDPERDLISLEKEILGISHSDFGSYLLQWWHLPEILIETCRHHHNSFSKNNRIGALCYIADIFIETNFSPSGITNISSDALDALEKEQSDLKGFYDYYKESADES